MTTTSEVSNAWSETNSLTTLGWFPPLKPHTVTQSVAKRRSILVTAFPVLLPVLIQEKKMSNSPTSWIGCTSVRYCGVVEQAPESHRTALTETSTQRDTVGKREKKDQVANCYYGTAVQAAIRCFRHVVDSRSAILQQSLLQAQKLLERASVPQRLRRGITFNVIFAFLLLNDNRRC